MALCPGQDTRYWRPGDIFDVTCGNCGSPVEFFKDDLRRRCRSCGAMVQNPKITLGCAQWCEHAKECLGYDPKETLGELEETKASGTSRPGSLEGSMPLAQVGDDSSLLQQLEDVIRAAVAGDARKEERIATSLATTDEAKTLLRSMEADRRTVLAAAMILGASDFTRSREEQKAWAPWLLEQVGLDGSVVDDINDVITSVIEERPGSTEAEMLGNALRQVTISQGSENT